MNCSGLTFLHVFGKVYANMETYLYRRGEGENVSIRKAGRGRALGVEKIGRR